ncbi:hypothetical protein Ga0466249_000850 [Sporomusaceae bacterium BoRhaA]|nr:hypothetical protein [Pelorhabdus rhamnosifermentans]
MMEVIALNMTAFISGLIVTLGYYFYTTRKARRKFDEEQSRNQIVNGSQTVQNPSSKE